LAWKPTTKTPPLIFGRYRADIVAARTGVSERVIMRQTGHKSIEMVRQANAFRENALNGVGALKNEKKQKPHT
jgi:hypothetical protein